MTNLEPTAEERITRAVAAAFRNTGGVRLNERQKLYLYRIAKSLIDDQRRAVKLVDHEIARIINWRDAP